MQPKRTLSTLIFAFTLITIWIVGCSGSTPITESPPEPDASLTDSEADQPLQADADVPEPASTPEIEAGLQDPEITADIQGLSINTFFEESFQHDADAGRVLPLGMPDDVVQGIGLDDFSIRT